MLSLGIIMIAFTKSWGSMVIYNLGYTPLSTATVRPYVDWNYSQPPSVQIRAVLREFRLLISHNTEQLIYAVY